MKASENAFLADFCRKARLFAVFAKNILRFAKKKV
jgi:hypothetical protein